MRQACIALSDSLQFHGILQARILEWVAFPFSRGSSQPRSPALQVESLPAEPQGKVGCLQIASKVSCLPGLGSITVVPVNQTTEVRDKGTKTVGDPGFLSFVTTLCCLCVLVIILGSRPFDRCLQKLNAHALYCVERVLGSFSFCFTHCSDTLSCTKQMARSSHPGIKGRGVRCCHLPLEQHPTGALLQRWSSWPKNGKPPGRMELGFSWKLVVEAEPGPRWGQDTWSQERDAARILSLRFHRSFQGSG